MNNRFVVAAGVLTAVIFLHGDNSIAQIGWEEANGLDCPEVCAIRGQQLNPPRQLNAVSHGFHAGNGNQPINVCATNTRDGRPGINVKPFQGQCIISYGENKSEVSQFYKCLCVDRN